MTQKLIVIPYSFIIIGQPLCDVALSASEGSLLETGLGTSVY